MALTLTLQGDCRVRVFLRSFNISPISDLTLLPYDSNCEVKNTKKHRTKGVWKR